MFVLCLIVQKGELSKHGMRLSKTHPSMNECKSKKRPYRTQRTIGYVFEGATPYSDTEGS